MQSTALTMRPALFRNFFSESRDTKRIISHGILKKHQILTKSNSTASVEFGTCDVAITKTFDGIKFTRKNYFQNLDDSTLKQRK